MAAENLSLHTQRIWTGGLHILFSRFDREVFRLPLYNSCGHAFSTAFPKKWKKLEKFLKCDFWRSFGHKESPGSWSFDQPLGQFEKLFFLKLWKLCNSICTCSFINCHISSWCIYRLWICGINNGICRYFGNIISDNLQRRAKSHTDVIDCNYLIF